jgi:hypothetical protein
MQVDPAVLRTASRGFDDIASGFFNEGAGPAVKSAAEPVSRLDCGAACREVGDSLLARAQVLGVDARKFGDNLDSAAFYYQKGDKDAAERIKFDTPGNDEKIGDDPGEPGYDPVHEYEEQLQQAGLLDGPAPDGYYKEWLQNAAKNGIPPEEIVKIARDHDITPASFDVLKGLERVQEDGPDKKSYFLLPEGVSGETARKAALMTYILNAGTNYGTAGDNNDFAETPYSSAEVQRIIDRQQANAWSYDQGVALANHSGARLTTTPNGMLMGLGAKDPVFALLSQNGGSTYGDIFLANIDNPKDPAEQLRDMIHSGHMWYAEPGGKAYEGNLDLDRILHHEERHSEQWAELGPQKFVEQYGIGIGIEQTTGHRNPFETNAGASDGGYPA